jgi:hypothetical protein
MGAGMIGAAMGIRMHSGWGAFVVATGDPAMVEVIHRGRFVVADPNIPGACQPYHYAAKMGLPDPTLRATFRIALKIQDSSRLRLWTWLCKNSTVVVTES